MKSQDMMRWPIQHLGRAAIVCLLALLVSVPLAVAQTKGPIFEPPALASAAGPMPQSLRAERQADSSAPLAAGQERAFGITLTGQKLPDCFGAPARPIDAVVLLDTSPSAGRPAPGSNLDRSQQILRSLWIQMNQPVYSGINGPARNSRLGLVTVDTGITTADEVNVRLPLTDTTTVIETAIEGLSNGADSGFDKGIKQATELLARQGRPDAVPVLILLLHDNFFARQDAVKAQTIDASKWAQVFVVGNWLNIREEERLQEADARALAGGQDAHVFLNPTAADLRRLFVIASGSDEDIISRELRVIEEITPFDQYDLVGLQGGGRLDGNRLVWNAQILHAGQSLEFGYRLRPLPSVMQALTAATTISWLDCNGFPQTRRLTTSVPMSVSPSSIPTQSSAMVPRQENKPTMTMTLTNTSTTGRSSDETTSQRQCVLTIGGVRLPCWVLLLLIPLLALLLLLFWPLRRRPKQTSKPGPPIPPPPEVKQIGRKHSESGEDNLPGQASDDAALVAQLREASELNGRIPAGGYGFARSHVAVKVFETTADLNPAADWNLMGMGPSFVWQRADGEVIVKTSRLVEILQEQIGRKGPLVAVWTQEPVDNATLEVRTTSSESAKEIRIQARSVYYLPKAGQAAPEKAYQLQLRFLNKPGYKVTVLPAMEIERSQR